MMPYSSGQAPTQEASQPHFQGHIYTECVLEAFIGLSANELG